MHTTIYKTDEQWELMYNTGNYIQYYLRTSVGKESEKE